MADATQDIKKLQLKIWLSKTIINRVHQFMTNNEAQMKFWNEVKPTNKILKVILNKI